MKKTIIALLALMPMALMAQTPREMYNELKQMPTPEQIAKEQVRIEKEAYYTAKEERIDAIQQVEIQKVAASQKADQARSQQQMAQQNKATAKQKQAKQQMAGDMMDIINNLGIPMEELAKMSDDEIEALVMQKAMPQMAQNTGLTPAEMEKLSKMSDKEAEAYMKAHPEVMARYQNSRYGQQANELRGIEQMQQAEDAQEELYNRIFELKVQMDDINRARLSQSAQSPFLFATPTREYEEAFFAPYDERISQIEGEFISRLDKDGLIDPTVDGSVGYAVLSVPSYTKSYYDRMNAVVAEANVAAAKEWCKTLQPQVEKYAAEVEELLPLVEEQERVYKQITDPAVRLRADKLMMHSFVYGAVRSYVMILKLRLEAPHMDTIEIPSDLRKYEGGKG